VQLSNQTTVLQAPAGAHSAKPDAFYEMVEALCPAPPYAELLRRRPRPHWDGHGDEASASEIIIAAASPANPDNDDLPDIPDFLDRRPGSRGKS
jgi:hypothetical protein